MTLKQIAERIMFTGIKVSEILEHWELRKDKTVDDLRKAIEKGKKDGNGKTEQELEWIELRLKDVLKKRQTRVLA